jgi:peptidoglycan-associated lipoprotein
MFKIGKVHFLILIGLLQQACSTSKIALNKGQTYFEKGEYELAIKSFLQDKAQDSTLALYKIAESYRLSNRPFLAAPYYERAQSAGSKKSDITFHLANIKKLNGDYNGASGLLKTYLTKDSLNADFVGKAKKEIISLNKIDSLSKLTTPYEIKVVEGINTKGAEFSPVMLNGDLIFTASRKNDIYKSNNLPFLGLYRAKLTNSLQGAKVELFSQNIFDENANEGTPTFSKDGKIMVFARGNNGSKKGRADLDLFSSIQNESGQWSIPEMISISDSAAWDSNPSFSADGKSLYFASNRDGGLGGIDIYRVNMDASGRFGTPQNMGNTINTVGDEMFPYVAKDGKLFFASDGHPGLGGLDVFVAERKNGKIGISNLGSPINSRFDDFGLSKYESKKGYFSSNRAGGQGDDDIYFFEDTTPDPVEDTPIIVKKEDPKPVIDPTIPKTVRYFLAGNITNLEGSPLDSARIRLIDNITNLQSSESLTIEDGKYGNYPLEIGTDYTILIERKGYFTKRVPFTMIGKEIPQDKLTKIETDTVFNVITKLDKPALNQVVNSVFSINTIYYDLNKSNIRGDAAPELDKVVTALKDNPLVKIELGSHTDSRSSSDYNQKLSQRRAESAVAYIISKGIDSGRIKAKGYGESQLVNKCVDGVECSEEDHQQNRRTEFKVIDIK